MTRWLQAAQKASKAGNKLNLPKQPAGSEVNSVNLVDFTGRKADTAPPGMMPYALDSNRDQKRAALRGFDAGQEGAIGEHGESAETCRDSKVIWLHQWRDAADDITNPDVWR